MIEQDTRTDFETRLENLIQQGVERSTSLSRPGLVSVTEEIDAVDPLKLFVHTSHFASERWYWEQSSEGFAIVGMGVASGTMVPRWVRFRASDEKHQELMEQAVIDPPEGAANPGPLFLAAFSFDAERKADLRLWRGFPPAYLLLPRVTLVKQNDRCFLTFNVLVSPNRDAGAMRQLTVQLRDRVIQSLEKETARPTAKVNAEPDEQTKQQEDEYRDAVAVATEVVRSEGFEKVVLARRREIKTENFFDVPNAIDRLRQDYPGCYTFAVARHSSIFLGATPEQLVKLDGKQVSTVCLAGSIRRGETEEQDAELGQQLLASHKDRHEHEICVRAIREALEPLCDELHVPDTPELMTVSNVHHLRTPVEGHLNNGATLLQLVERLHPTPAVGGYPKEKALEFLRDNEGFNRGWYASPLGWIDSRGNGEFVVTLRSALIRGQKAHLFAGCGIVDESDPEQELAESEIKMRPMLWALSG
jgi:isochorismate synthase